jgi:hypothetical protein
MNSRKQHRQLAYAILLSLALVPFAAFASHGGSSNSGGGGSTTTSGGGSGGSGGGGGTSGGGGGGGGGTSGGGGSGGGGGGGNLTTQDICALVAPGGTPTMVVPGTVLIRDTFGLGPNFARPTGADGKLEQTGDQPTGFNGNALGGFWAEQPCNNTVIWMTPPLRGSQTIVFGPAFPDPNEPPSPMLPASLQNGAVGWSASGETVLGNPAALVPFQPPSIPYEVSVDTLPMGQSWFDVGFTSSNALIANFESAGQAWMRVQYSNLGSVATVELRTNGLSGASIRAVFSSVQNEWDTLTVKYDPVLKLVTGYFNGQAVGTLPYDASLARFAGFETNTVADNFVLKASN